MIIFVKKSNMYFRQDFKHEFLVKSFIYLMLLKLREGLKKKIVVNSTKKKTLDVGIILRRTYFFQFFGGGTLLSLDLGPTGVSNL